MIKKKSKVNMKTGYFVVKNIMVIAAVLFAFAAEAKLKGLPVMKSYKDYNLSKANVESLKYTVYAPKVEGETVTKGEVADFIAEIFFDDKGYRVKEIVYNMEGEVDVKIAWQYSEEDGTVIETRTDKEDKLLARTEYLVNYKFNTVLARRYEDIEDHVTKIVLTNVLRYDELWTEDSKHKTVSHKRTQFDPLEKIAIKQTISEETLEKPYTLYMILESLTAPIDYTWMIDYNERTFKALNRKTRKEPIYDGSRYEYKAKSKLLSAILHYGADKKLKNETNYSYSFDSNNNWTEIIQKENNNPRFFIQRDIRYRV
ncbi:MAG: hypothetical protein LBG80_15820 [Bacteroidales bacterium]|jgi:hypothetical protein|nr:hypothetical protein [Bacteroidales bacterium]